MAFELAVEAVAGTGPVRTRVIVLHGIFGRGRNWRSLCRRVTRARPDIEFLLADLRMHGDSRAAPPPHTLATAAADVSRLAEKSATEVILGHSFGGKVALALLSDAPPPSVRQAWIIDASPGRRQAGSRQVDEVMAALDALPETFPDRAAVLAALAERNLPPAIAGWLAQGFIRAADGTFHGFDRAALRALLADHDAADLWSVVKAPPCEVRFVLGGRSDTVGPADRARLEGLGVTVDVIAGAGHWVHVDAPDEMVTLLSEALIQ